MKKFIFSLERLMSYKQKLFDAQRARLAELAALLAKQQKARALKAREYADSIADYKLKAAAGLNTTQIAVHKNYIRDIERTIERMDKEIEETAARVERQKAELVRVRTELRSVELLREKRLEEHNQKESKEQELFIEEFVVSSRYSKL